jgi:hypothetical protein
VPTAWGIYREGLQRLYRVQTGSEESLPDEQLDEWLAEHGYEDLGYSTLVDTIAPDPAVRRAMLAGYFDGVEPGKAHERLAELAAAGFLRVFVMTNFDR